MEYINTILEKGTSEKKNTCINNKYAWSDAYKKPFSRCIRMSNYRVDVKVARSCVQTNWCNTDRQTDRQMDRQMSCNWRKSGPGCTEWSTGITHKDSVWLPVRCSVCRICPFKKNMLPVCGEDTERHWTIGCKQSSGRRDINMSLKKKKNLMIKTIFRLTCMVNLKNWLM